MIVVDNPSLVEMAQSRFDPNSPINQSQKVDAEAFNNRMQSVNGEETSIFDISESDMYTEHQIRLEMEHVNNQRHILEELKQMDNIPNDFFNQIDTKLSDLQDKIDQIHWKEQVSKEIQPENFKKPIVNFMSFLSKGENQLLQIEKDLTKLFANNAKPVGPELLLRFQLRMNHVCHQIDLFSNTLNKAISSARDIQNTQI